MENVEKFGQRMRETGTPVPSVGRVVHYFSYGTPGGEFPAATPRAAIITEVDEPGVWNSSVGLCVLNPSGIFFNQHCPYGGDVNPPKGGTWCWTPYVAPVHLQGVGVPAPDHQATVEAATPEGSVFAAEATTMQNMQAGRLYPSGAGTLELRTRIMELEGAMRSIYKEQPVFSSEGSADPLVGLAKHFDAYVSTVREIARKALGS